MSAHEKYVNSSLDEEGDRKGSEESIEKNPEGGDEGASTVPALHRWSSKESTPAASSSKEGGEIWKLGIYFSTSS